MSGQELKTIVNEEIARQFPEKSYKHYSQLSPKLQDGYDALAQSLRGQSRGLIRFKVGLMVECIIGG